MWSNLMCLLLNLIHNSCLLHFFLLLFWKWKSWFTESHTSHPFWFTFPGINYFQLSFSVFIMWMREMFGYKFCCEDSNFKVWIQILLIQIVTFIDTHRNYSWNEHNFRCNDDSDQINVQIKGIVSIGFSNIFIFNTFPSNHRTNKLMDREKQEFFDWMSVEILSPPSVHFVSCFRLVSKEYQFLSIACNSSKRQSL